MNEPGTAGPLSDFEAFAADVVHDLRKVGKMITDGEREILDVTPATIRAAIVQRLEERADFPTRDVVKVEGSIDGDPYAFEGETFAQLVAYEGRRNEDRASLMVRQRVLDDVRATHATLDALGVPSGLPLTARLFLLDRDRAPVMSIESPLIANAITTRRKDRAPDSLGAEGAHVPDPTEVLADLAELDAVKLLAIFRDLELVDATDPAPTSDAEVADMVNAACHRAIDTGKLAELAKAAREATS